MEQENGFVIRAVGLKKKYPKVNALDGLTLDVQQGEVLCLIGPNGAGKTTLLQLLGGVIYPSAGHVKVLGRDRWKENFEIRKGTTYLPVNPVVGASPTPYEYLRFLGQIYGLPKAQFIEKTQRLARQMRYTEYLTRPWAALSTGLVKKAGLIGCFLPEVAVRFLDEPFAGGIDPLGMEMLYQWMQEARGRGETILFSTQVLEQAETVADRVALLNRGRVEVIGAPGDLIAQAGLEAAEPRALAQAFIRLTEKS